MAKIIETWIDDSGPDVVVRLTERLEGATVFTPVNVTGKVIKVRLWLNGALYREITNTTIIDGPAGRYKFPRLQSPVIAAGKYGVATRVETNGNPSEGQTYPSSVNLPTWKVLDKGEAQ